MHSMAHERTNLLHIRKRSVNFQAALHCCYLCQWLALLAMGNQQLWLMANEVGGREVALCGLGALALL